MATAAAQDLSSWDSDPRLFLFTSLTSGSSQIFTATSRLELILKAHKIPFQAIDLATDEKARKLWQRRAGKRKLPGLVKEGMVLGDINEVEEWNEFGELKDVIGPVPATTTQTLPPAMETPRSPIEDGPIRSLATETAALALERNKNPRPNESKIRSLDGASPEVTEAIPAKVLQSRSSIALPPSASSSSIAVTEIPSSGPVAAAETHAAAAGGGLEDYHPRDPTDAVPSAGTPLKAPAAPVSPISTPSTVTPLAAQSSDSIAGGAGLADSAERLASTPSAQSREPATQQAGSPALRHRGSDLQTASEEQIKGVEQQQRIEEEPASPVETQKTAAADAGKAGDSVDD